MELKDYTDLISTVVSVGGFVISVITLRILRNTLKESIDINRKQYELIAIEANRAAREIRPRFKFRYEVSNDADRQWLIIQSDQHLAKNISIEFERGVTVPESIYIVEELTFDFVDVGWERPIMYGDHGGDPFSSLTAWPVTIYIKYFDEDGREYEQRFRQEPPQRAMSPAYHITYPPQLKSEMI
ncbi:MAG: hypothetical protein JKY70_02285 [Mucilaginibacter sp.]|nr:hypothetical protein [Mucilaginibacter sp.]